MVIALVCGSRGSGKGASMVVARGEDEGRRKTHKNSDVARAWKKYFSAKILNTNFKLHVSTFASPECCECFY